MVDERFSVKKDPGAKLPYSIDWTLWLEGETIVASTWSVPTGITKVSDSFTSKVTTIWLEGGTAGSDYQVVNHVTTSGNKQDERTIFVYVRNR